MVMKKRNKMMSGWILIAIGLIINYGTHAWIFFMGLPAEQVGAHSGINYLGGILTFIGAMMLGSMMRK